MKVVIDLLEKETASIHRRIQEQNMLLINRQKADRLLKEVSILKRAVKILKEYQHKKDRISYDND